jgi:Pyruvate/2-oxoacid:ferredoxin oxidoreductase delta subunit
MSTQEIYRKVSETISGAGGTPIQVTDTLIKIIRIIVNDDETDFVLAFSEKNSQTMEQLVETMALPEQVIEEKMNQMAAKGVIFNQPNRQGVIVYRLLPLVNVGVFEYTFMQKLERSAKNKELADLFTQLFEEGKGLIQGAFDDIIGMMGHFPAVDRTVPVRINQSTGQSTIIEIKENLGQPAEIILQTKNVVDLIEKFDEIAVGHCFCRHHKDLMDEPCKQTNTRESCFTFGKSARYTTEQGFMRMIDKKEALDILLKSEEDGLIHKAYHPNFDVSKDETSVCNCCKCCCGNSISNMIAPIINFANYLAEVDPETCTGCETCHDYCHTEAITLNKDNVSEVDIERCLGCGICAYFCPEDAIRLSESTRTVRIAPKREV